MVDACHRQVRANESGPFALDFPAFLQFAALKGLAPDFVAGLLPAIESILINAFRESSK